MSGIVLSASVRQNLLSLQSTASLLATTQNDLATGNKVNSALDNPTNYFTAQSLNNRAGDIGNLLDSIGNGVQVLQAANTGITSLQSLIQSAQSIANQALQTSVGYSTKSNVSTTIAGATASNLLGNTTYASAIAAGNVLYSGAAGGTSPATSASLLGATAGVFTGTAATGADGSTALAATDTLIGTSGGATVLGTAPTDGETLTVNGHTITFRAGTSSSTSAGIPAGYVSNGGNIATDGNGDSVVYLGNSTTPAAKVSDLLQAIDIASGVDYVTINGSSATIATGTGQTASSVAAGKISLESSTGADLSVTGDADLLKSLGLTTATGGGNVTVSAARTTATGTLGSSIQDGSTLNVDGHVITFKNAATPATTGTTAPSVPSGSGVSGNVVTDGNGNSTVYLQSGTTADVLKAIDIATGVDNVSITNGAATVTAASGQISSSINASGQLKISTGVNADLSITGTGNALNALGLAGNTGTASAFTAARTSGVGGISGKTLTFTSFNGGTAVNVTFGSGTGQVNTLNQLNTALQADNLSATLNANGLLTISASNDYASSTLGSTAAGGSIGGTLSTSQNWSTASAPVADPVAQAARASLVSQYNGILAQIDTTAQDSSFNGVNLLNGDQLKLVFDETGKSSLNITGVTFNSAGLGLSQLTQGVDFIDNNATNKVLNTLTSAASTLRSEASSLGSNLSVVQIRQDFNKNLINVLQTGSSNLTLADTNEEAANSQALQTRQSIAVSALALANQSQQSVLQLLR